MARFKAPADSTGISLGGQHFPVDKGHITLPDDFTAEGVAAVVAHGFTPVIDKNTPMPAPLLPATPEMIRQTNPDGQ